MARIDSYTHYVLKNLETSLKEGETHAGYTVIVGTVCTMSQTLIRSFAVKTENLEELVKAVENGRDAYCECLHKLALDDKLLALGNDAKSNHPDGTLLLSL